MNTYFCFLRKANKFILMNSYIFFFINFFYQLYFLHSVCPYEWAFLIRCVRLINASFCARFLICLGIGWFYINTYFCFWQKENKIIIMNSYTSLFIRYFYQLRFHLFFQYVWMHISYMLCFLMNSSFYMTIIILHINNLLIYCTIFQFYMNA